MANFLAYLVAACLCLIGTNGGPCSEDWIFADGQCFGFGSSQVSWIEATALCSLFGSRLAEVSSQGENSFIATELRQRKVQRAWIGATDMFNDSNWQWIGSKTDLMSFSDWFAQDASDIDEEDNCAVIQSSHNYQWVKDRCNHEYNFVCKTKAEEIIVG